MPGASLQTGGEHRHHVVVAHPSPDLYGSDLQLLESITGFVTDGWSVDVVLPRRGPLVERLESAGAHVLVVPFPVLSKTELRPARWLPLVAGHAAALVRLGRLLRAARPDAVWVNTLTEPVWLAAAALTRVPAVCHVHEAEEDQPWLLRAGLTGPLLAARSVVVNSGAARRAVVSVVGRLERRTVLVYNGVPAPAVTTPPRDRAPGDALTVALAGRLSPRKGTDVALEAVALVRDAGVDAHLHLYGSVFAGYEWFEDELRARAARPDLDGAVTFHGYVPGAAQAMAGADVVLVPSRQEPFGNVAVEAMLAGRPVIASAVQGLAEIVADGRTGLLVPPDDASALAEAVLTVAADPDAARRRAEAGRTDAEQRFTPARYRREVADVLRGVVLDGRAARVHVPGPGPAR